MRVVDPDQSYAVIGGLELAESYYVILSALNGYLLPYKALAGLPMHGLASLLLAMRALKGFGVDHSYCSQVNSKAGHYQQD